MSEVAQLRTSLPAMQAQANNTPLGVRASERLAELEAEYERGKQMLLQLDEQRQTVARSLTRIEGAMTVLRADLGIRRPDEDQKP